jgi:Bacterial SH3 domain
MWSMMMRCLVIGAILLAATAPNAWAQTRCRVLDPTNTPLNVRTAPYGAILGILPNGVLVSVIDRATDKAGKPWVYVAAYDTGRPIGWVFREFIACF